MKNNVVVMLVLVVASMASARYVWTVDSGNITVGTDTHTSGYDLSLVVSGGDILLDSSNIVFNPDYSWDFAPAIITDSETHVRAAASQFFCPPLGPGELFTVPYTGTAGTVDVIDYLANWPDQEVVGTIEIPELATLLLMGLGGVLLKRKAG